MAQHNQHRDEAYQLASPDQHRAYYDRWAKAYEQDFAARMGYIYPAKVAKHFLSMAEPTDSPVLDIGCGTGLGGLPFRDSGVIVDGADISAGMLEEARRKRIYRDLLSADLTNPATLPKGVYGGLISSGTFTHGHLGPEVLDAIFGLGRPSALAVLGINARHYHETGFDNALQRLASQGIITSPQLTETAIYADPAQADTESLTALLVACRVC